MMKKAFLYGGGLSAGLAALAMALDSRVGNRIDQELRDHRPQPKRRTARPSAPKVVVKERVHRLKGVRP